MGNDLGVKQKEHAYALVWSYRCHSSFPICGFQAEREYDAPANGGDRSVVVSIRRTITRVMASPGFSLNP